MKKAQIKLTNILLSVILLGTIIGGISIFLVGSAAVYSGDITSFEDSNLTGAFLDESNKISNQLATAQLDLQTVEEETGVIDRIGAFLRSGYTSVKSFISSITSVTRIISLSVNQIPFIGSFGTILITGLSLVMIAIFIGIFAHFLIKSERL